MSEEFTEGDRVCLISGSVTMTISEINEKGIVCLWEEKGKFNTQIFPKVVLKKYTFNVAGKSRPTMQNPFPRL